MIVPPRALSELEPLLCKSVRKLFKKDCKAAVPVELAAFEVVAFEVVAVEPVTLVLVAAAACVPAAASGEAPALVELPPVKALISVLNAELSWDKVPEDRPEDRPEEPVEELSSWLPAMSLIKPFRATIKPC